MFYIETRLQTVTGGAGLMQMRVVCVSVKVYTGCHLHWALSQQPPPPVTVCTPMSSAVWVSSALALCSCCQLLRQGYQPPHWPVSQCRGVRGLCSTSSPTLPPAQVAGSQ